MERQCSSRSLATRWMDVSAPGVFESTSDPFGPGSAMWLVASIQPYHLTSVYRTFALSPHTDRCSIIALLQR